MVESINFNPQKLARLNDPQRLEMIKPEAIWSALALSDPQVLVDIGAGTGFFARQFARKIPAGKVYACDTSAVMVAWMEENLVVENIRPLLSGKASVPLADGCADLVYMISVHHELLEPLKLLGEIHRLLKPGGKVALIDWQDKSTPGGPPREIRISEGVVVEQLRLAGFSQVCQHAVLPYHFLISGKK